MFLPWIISVLQKGGHMSEWILQYANLNVCQSLEIPDHPYVDTTELQFSGVTFGFDIVGPS